ncbi:MAG: DUF192 domain-containing protein [Anaerolineae bacterium]|nr:DUF192 domain-containing protein [Anaerolineae bacterium]
MSHPIFIQNITKQIANPACVPYCDSFLCRLRGLMFRPRLARDEGLLLVEKRDSRLDTSIHMLFVNFDLAVFWIDSNMSIVDKVIAKSWRPAYFPRVDAKYTLELHTDRWDDYQIGDKVEFKHA